MRLQDSFCLFRKALFGLVTASVGARTLGQTTLNTNAIADAFVTTGTNGSLSSSNFGAAGALAVAAPNLPEGEFQTVIKFQLSGIASSFNALYGAGSWTVQSVTLQLNASSHNNSIFNNIAAGNFNVSLMQNSSWVEGTGTGGTPTTNGISYDTLVSNYVNNATDQALGTFSFGGGGGTTNYSLNLSSGLVSNLLNGNIMSLRLFAADDQVSYLFTSRNSGSVTTSPTLVITVVQGPVAPSLTILYSNDQAIVSWPPAVTNWTLQTNGDLTTTNWSNYGGTVANNTVTNLPAGGNLFFRLAQP